MTKFIFSMPTLTKTNFKIKNLWQVLCNFPDVLSLTANDEPVQPLRGWHLSKYHTVSLLINLGQCTTKFIWFTTHCDCLRFTFSWWHFNWNSCNITDVLRLPLNKLNPMHSIFKFFKFIQLLLDIDSSYNIELKAIFTVTLPVIARISCKVCPRGPITYLCWDFRTSIDTVVVFLFCKNNDVRIRQKQLNKMYFSIML